MATMPLTVYGPSTQGYTLTVQGPPNREEPISILKVYSIDNSVSLGNLFIIRAITSRLRWFLDSLFIALGFYLSVLFIGISTSYRFHF